MVINLTSKCAGTKLQNCWRGDPPDPTCHGSSVLLAKTWAGANARAWKRTKSMRLSRESTCLPPTNLRPRVFVSLRHTSPLPLYSLRRAHPLLSLQPMPTLHLIFPRPQSTVHNSRRGIKTHSGKSHTKTKHTQPQANKHPFPKSKAILLLGSLSTHTLTITILP